MPYWCDSTVTLPSHPCTDAILSRYWVMSRLDAGENRVVTPRKMCGELLIVEDLGFFAGCPLKEWSKCNLSADEKF